MLTLSSLLRALSTSWRRRSRPALPTWSWSSSFFHTTWWANENARRSSVITSAASSTVTVQMHFGDGDICTPRQGNGEVRGQIRERGRSGAVFGSHQHHQVSTVQHQRTHQQDPFLLFIELILFQSDGATWTQCPKWQWQWLSWTRRETYRREFQTQSSTSWIGSTSTGLVKE